MLVGSCLLAGSSIGVRAQDAPSMIGFSADGAARELALESAFDRQIDPAELRTWLQQMSAEPNHVGSPHDRRNAEFMLAQFKRWGWDAHIETFQILYPTPKIQRLTMLAPRRFSAILREPAIAADRTSNQTGLPPYAVYGADGDVTAKLIYVNYGMPEDYKELERRGISVKDRIVIARYGDDWRGLKPKLAYQHGAIGCIIYSDPRDDGYYRGDVYPRGGWRPPGSVQRGSVLDTPIYPGDPLTPNIGATRNAKRLDISEATNLVKIPVLPISYADAEPLLAALGGAVGPDSWHGALPIPYHLGPGPAKVNLVIKSEWTLKPIYDVIAKITGSDMPDEWVIRGNHHDGWVFGACDPLSGTVALMEEGKAFGALLKSGWRPRRTLIYASWDAEEPGWIGSTEWAEQHAEDLRRHAVLYLNSDTNGRGFLVPGGSHSLQHLVNEVAAGITDPETLVSVQARLRAKLRTSAFERGSPEELQARASGASPSDDIPIAALGSGTDWTPFLQHLGIATLDLSYGGEDTCDAVLHSNYDSFDDFIRFGDPYFAYGVAEAQTVGHVAMRSVEASVLPLRLIDFATTLEGYVKELHELAEHIRQRTTELSSLLDSDAFGLASDPKRPLHPPPREAAVPYLNFAPLDNAVLRLLQTAARYDGAYDAAAKLGLALDPVQRTELNDLLRSLEQLLTAEQGLPGRTWFKHLIYAPGLNTGYDAKTVPAVREAIEQRDWNQANEYIGVTAQALQKYCDQVDRAEHRLHH
jgi:N-acetylated-alpha-linked acidic dipeptidase